MFDRQLPARRLPRRTATLAGVALALAVAAPAVAQAQAGELPATGACDRTTLAAQLVVHDPDFEAMLAEATDDYDPLGIVCTEVNGDGVPDALWAISGGGSGGAMNAGIALGAAGGAAPTIVHEQLGSHQVIGFVKGKPAIGTPRYAKNDPNCCPTRGWRWHTYTPAADGTVRVSRLKTSKRKRCPIEAEV